MITDLNAIDYRGALCIEHEKDGARFIREIEKAAKFLRLVDFYPSEAFEQSMNKAAELPLDGHPERVSKIIGFDETAVSVSVLADVPAEPPVVPAEPPKQQPEAELPAGSPASTTPR